MPTDEQPGTLLAAGIIGCAVVLALGLALWEWRESADISQPSSDSAPSQVAAFDAEVSSAKTQAELRRSVLKHLLEEQRQRAQALINPGPEPSWWYHPVDHATWTARKAAFDEGIAAVRQLQDQVREAQQQLNSALGVVSDRERLAALAHRAYAIDQPGSVPTPVRDALRWGWNHLLRPLLHWLLIASLLLFAINRLMRLALIRGWLREQRLATNTKQGDRGAQTPNTEHRTPNDFSPNGITLHLQPGERFWLHASLVRGRASYEWRLFPPHPFGSVLGRWWHRMYFGLAYVDGDTQSEPLTLRGTHPRGNFQLIALAADEEFHIRQSHVYGYSATITAIHTRLRFWPTFWVLRRHFIACYRGPGHVLLYAESPLEFSTDHAFPPERVVAFSVARRFQAKAPTMRSAQGQLMNLLWSHDVSWRLLDPGSTLVEAHIDGGTNPNDHGIVRRWISHILGFLRL